VNRRQFVASVSSLTITSIVGCADQPQNMTEQEIEWTELSDGHREMYRAIDREAGVVIYADSTINAGGMGVVPVEDTDLVGDSP